MKYLIPLMLLSLNAFANDPVNLEVKYSEHFENINGSVTYIEPRVYADGSWRRISSYSSNDGVCKLMGHLSMVESDTDYPGFFKTAQIKVDSEGSIISFVKSKNGGSSFPTHYFTLIVCKGHGENITQRTKN